jgi:hypothetical protein
MSVFAYFERRVPVTRVRLGGGVEGLRVRGEVLTGRRPLEEKLYADAVLAGRRDVEYARTGRLDPVLRGHLGPQMDADKRR